MPAASDPAFSRPTPWRIALALLAAAVIAAQLVALAWVAQGQVERGQALQGGGAVTRLISADRCLDYRVAPKGIAAGCSAKSSRPVVDAR
jgi:hypothetical protein